MGYDLVPEPKIIDAALRACRRLNDFASAVRILEVVKVGGSALFPLLEPGSGRVCPGFFLLQRETTRSCCQNQRLCDEHEASRPLEGLSAGLAGGCNSESCLGKHLKPAP